MAEVELIAMINPDVGGVLIFVIRIEGKSPILIRPSRNQEIQLFIYALVCHFAPFGLCPHFQMQTKGLNDKNDSRAPEREARLLYFHSTDEPLIIRHLRLRWHV